jgi:hypothetical protein
MHCVQMDEVQVLQNLGQAKHDDPERKNMPLHVMHYCLMLHVRHSGGHSLQVFCGRS